MPSDHQASVSANADRNAQSTLIDIGRLRRSNKIPIKIPKAARFLAADTLALVIDKAVGSDSPEDGIDFFTLLLRLSPSQDLT